MAGIRLKEWICFILFRFLLPLAFLTATIFRFSGFSLLYGCFALVNPLIARPTHSSISRHTGRYLTAAVILCAVTLTAQVVFQSYVAITQSKSQGNDSLLQNCSSLEKTLRQIGLQKIDPSDTLSSTRIVLPDVISFVFSVFVLVTCRLLLKSPELVQTANDESGETIRARLFRFGVVAADFLGNFLVIAFTGLCGITTPSALNGFYFLCFLIVATIWSCGVRLGLWFSVYRFIILIYCGLHLLATYINQFQFMEEVWFNSFQNNTTVERIVGLNRFITVDCSEPWVLHIRDGIKWTEYFNVAALLSFYFLVAIEVRRRNTSSTLEVEFSPLISDEAAILPSEDGSSLTDVTSRSHEAQGLIQTTSPTQRYHSMDKAELNLAADLGETSGERAPPGDTPARRRKESSQLEATKHVIGSIVTFAMQQSYIATLVVMMAWSITYPSWLAFVFLITACLIWMIPKKRVFCMRFSPLIVVYAECLLTITYVYGFDAKLPDHASGGYNLKDIGLIKYEYPVGPLAVQAAFTCVFWLNLYQFIWESSSNNIGLSRVDASSLETLEGAAEGDAGAVHAGRRKKKLVKFKAITRWFWDLLCKYWIFLCGALFLLMALQEAVIFRMVYMVLFLYFVITFQFSYAYWRCSVKLFWSIVIIYSMIVLIAIYVFQFEFVIEKWMNATGMSESLMHDLGFRKYNTATLFVELLTPTSFLIFIILHLHYFQKTFLALSDVNRFRNEDTFSNRSDGEVEQEHPTTSSDVATSDDKPSGYRDQLLLLWNRATIYIVYATVVIWRLLEVHIHKLILMSVFLVCVNDVCAVNVVLVLLLVVFMLLGWKRVMSFVSMFLCALIILIRMVYQLELVNEERTFTNCTGMRNMNTSETGNPPPFNQTVDNADYLGLEKTLNMSRYVRGYMILVLLFTFESIIVVHQKQYFNHPQHQRPPAGIVFLGVNRGQADIDLIHCAMYLINYGFYKFGKEICFIMTVVTMVVRLDVFSVLYGILLGCFLLLGRRKCRCLWPGYIILLAILIIVQYLSCVGAPIGLCWQYPWLIPQTISVISNLKVFLFLPDYLKAPDATKMIADFFQLLFVCLQWRVYGEENRPSAAEEGGSNRSITKEIADVQLGIKNNPVEDFVSYKDSYLDYVKVGVFYYSFWITLLVLFITGTIRISIFCLGYLIACFFFLWFGQDLLLKPVKTIQRMWTVVLVYSYFVILLKCCLQLAGCVFYDSIACWVVQLFNIVCLQPNIYELPPKGMCEMNKDMAGMSWDAASFAFLLFLIRVYKTWYFQHIVTDLKVDNTLASRGSELINQMLFSRVEVHRQQEETLLFKIRRKMERIKLRQIRLNPTSAALSTDHYVVIRSGDYYMFDDMTEDELELQTEASEDRVLDEDIKKPGPLQILNAGLQGGPKVALEMWDHPSPSSPPPMSPVDIGSYSGDQMTVDQTGDVGSSEEPGGSAVTFVPGSPSVEKSSVVDTVDGKQKDGDEEKSDSLCDKLVNVIKMVIVVVRAFIEKVILFLNNLSKDYSAVSVKLRDEKEKHKRVKRIAAGGSASSHSPLIDTSEEDRTVARPSDIALHVEVTDDGENRNEIEKQKQAEQTFHREMPLLFRLIVAALQVVFSHSDLLCYFAMVLNVLMSGSVVSLVYPILSFLWALLSTPRPSKTFWVFIITYTEVLIIIKYVFQFAFIPWNASKSAEDLNRQEAVFSAPYILGIEKKDTYAIFDIVLLFCVFIHRSVLKQHGLWKDAQESQDDLENAELASRQVTPAASPGDNKRIDVDFGGSGDATMRQVSGHSNSFQDPEDDDDQDTIEVLRVEQSAATIADDEADVKSKRERTDEPGCCGRCTKSLSRFCHNVRNPKYSAATDVYARMFLCDLITFIIVIFGYSSFGPGQWKVGGDDWEKPTQAEYFLRAPACLPHPRVKQSETAYCFNKSQWGINSKVDDMATVIPASFLGMMLAQFILIIIDRAIYLRKQILAKLVFQIFLIILVHVWMFFGLPEITKRRFVDNVAAQLWYFTKCIYFGFSSYQIRCGYPTRMLGNFLTKKYNYLNLYSFQGFLVIPFLLELRALMDWMFTDTTLALGSWLQMEDIYSNVFVIKCNRRAEKTYPVQRGQKRRALVKYGLGGIILFLLIFIIWFPLLLFSLSESIFEPCPPVSVTVSLKIQGYEPMFKMTTQGNDISVITQAQYDALLHRAPANMTARSFLYVYRREDIYNCNLLGMSAATWDITPPYMDRLKKHLNQTNETVRIDFSLAFTRDPAPSLKSETVLGEFQRNLDSHNPADKKILADLVEMLSVTTGSNISVVIPNIFPHFVSVPASGKIMSVDHLFYETYAIGYLSGNASLHLSVEGSTGAKWWTIQRYEDGGGTKDYLNITSFNERIAPAGVLSVLSNYGVIGLYVSLVLVIGRFVRMWIQGLSFKIMFVELPNPDVLLKLCLDIYMVRESGELMLEEELFAQLIFLYRSPETLIKVTKHAKMD